MDMNTITARQIKEIWYKIGKLESKVKALFWINAVIEIPLLILILSVLLGG
jgi:hypothetical protein